MRMDIYEKVTKAIQEEMSHTVYYPSYCILGYKTFVWFYDCLEAHTPDALKNKKEAKENICEFKFYGVLVIKCFSVAELIAVGGIPDHKG